MKGLTSRPWGAAKGILILGTHRVLQIETSEVVLVEVTNALRRKGVPTEQGREFALLLQKLRLTVYPRPSDEDVREGLRRYLPHVRHQADIPVLVAAITAQPDWLVSDNPSHFNPEVARVSGLRIVTPEQLMRYLSVTDAP